MPGASLWLITVGGLWFCLWRRRWRFAGLPVVVIGLLLGPPPAPDLLMSEDGRVLGLRDEKGVVHVASARTDRFVSRHLGAAQRPGGRQALDRQRRRGGGRASAAAPGSAAGARDRGASPW